MAVSLTISETIDGAAARTKLAKSAGVAMRRNMGKNQAEDMNALYAL